jgi:hypothetical protein
MAATLLSNSFTPSLELKRSVDRITLDIKKYQPTTSLFDHIAAHSIIST